MFFLLNGDWIIFVLNKHMLKRKTLVFLEKCSTSETLLFNHDLINNEKILIAYKNSSF